jgi:hypothetical protein
MPNIGVHGNSVISDTDHPVRINFGIKGAIVTPPAGVQFPYDGAVHFLFQNPPMEESATFNITHLSANVTLSTAHLQRVDILSGPNTIFTKSRSSPDVRLLNAVDLSEDVPAMDRCGGLCVIYTIHFLGVTSSVEFDAVCIEFHA